MKAAWKNILKTSTVTASSAASGYPAYRLYDDVMGRIWMAASSANASITIDQGASPLPVSCLAVPAGHTHSGRTLSWERSADGLTWDNILTPWVQADSSLIFKTIAAAGTWRYLRFSMTGGTPWPSCGELFMGDVTTFEATPDFGSFSSLEPNVKRVESVSGVPTFMQMGPSKRVLDYDVKLIDATEKALFEDWITTWGGCSPFVFVDQEGVALFGEFTEQPHLVSTSVGRWSTRLTIRQVL